MARDFKLEEAELDSWFDEQKEKLTEEYDKKIDAILRKQEEEENKKSKKQAEKPTDEQEKALIASIDREFLASMRKVRGEYQKKYDKIQTGKENAKKRKKTAGNILGPLLFFLRPIWKAIKASSKFVWTAIKTALGFVKKEVSSSFEKTFYHIHEFYAFHMKSRLDPFLQPVRNILNMFFFRPIRKSMERFTEIRKSTVKEAIKIFKKYLDITIKIAQKVFGFLKKYALKVFGVLKKVFKKISDMKKKFIDPVLAPITNFLSKFKKKEEE